MSPSRGTQLSAEKAGFEVNANDPIAYDSDQIPSLVGVSLE